MSAEISAIFRNPNSQLPAFTGTTRLRIKPEQNEWVTFPGGALLTAGGVGENVFGFGASYTYRSGNVLISALYFFTDDPPYPSFPLYVRREGKDEPELRVEGFGVEDTNGFYFRGGNVYDHKIQSFFHALTSLIVVASGGNPGPGIEREDRNIIQPIINSKAGEFMNAFVEKHGEQLKAAGLSPIILTKIKSQFR